MTPPKVMNSHLYMKYDPIFYLQISEATTRFHNPPTSNLTYVYLLAPPKVTVLNVIPKPPAAHMMLIHSRHERYHDNIGVNAYKMLSSLYKLFNLLPHYH